MESESTNQSLPIINVAIVAHATWPALDQQSVQHCVRTEIWNRPQSQCLYLDHVCIFRWTLSFN